MLEHIHMNGRTLVRSALMASAALFAVSSANAVDAQTHSMAPVNGARYATDAYPGFDRVEEIIKPERKEPKWFDFINGVNRSNAKMQYEYCERLAKDGEFAKAAKQFDALVRRWPTEPEAPKAQERYAELLLSQLDDAEESFAQYRYLLDFYSLNCDYNAIADKLYKMAGLLRERGKEVMFVRFENIVDVRRAYEACVLHAPGASWVPEAMLTIAELREKDGDLIEGVNVYENLRNLHPETPEAKVALRREAELRVRIIKDREYNRARTLDTANFLKLALRTCRETDAGDIRAFLDEMNALLEQDDWKSAKFYDSPTRTKRSAITAYEKFISDYPDSVHAEEAKERLGVLKGEEKK